MSRDITNLEQMLDRIDSSPDDQGQVSLGRIVEAVGKRSFGPLLLMAGVILASPISGIPGIPTSMGVLVLLIAVQLLFRREYFWLPQWLLKRSIERSKLSKALKWLRPPARFIDRLLRPRLMVLVNIVGIYVIAVLCVLIAAALPMMELVPFSAHGAGVALTGFGLALIARDGLLALLAFLITAGTFGLAFYHMILS